MNDLDRALAVLEANPTVYGHIRDGNTITLVLSFRGCDDDEFTINADLSTVQFSLPDTDPSKRFPEDLPR